LRDLGLLQSAVAQHMMGKENEYFHSTLSTMAAAYLFHLVPITRLWMATSEWELQSIIFLEVNGIEVNVDEEEFEAMVLSVAAGSMNKANAIALFEKWFATK
jgi:prophage maintenance system killer protein